MKKQTAEDIAESLEKRASKEWNEAISSRLAMVDQFLSQDSWVKGIDPFLRSVQAHTILRILNEKSTDQDYLRGFAAGLLLVISLPSSVAEQIARKEHPREGPKGDAGY